MLLRHFIILAMALAIAAPTTAQTPLSEFVGTYADGPKHQIEIAADSKGQLVAVIDDATYPLKVTGASVLSNNGGGQIPFKPGPDGHFAGYTDHGVFHRKLSSKVSAETIAMLTAPARPAGTAYRYKPPADLHDGIGGGDIERTPFGVATARQIVAKVTDGTYPGVHSVLLYQGGKLVLEEYFYGYSVNRTQQLRSPRPPISRATS